MVVRGIDLLCDASFDFDAHSREPQIDANKPFLSGKWCGVGG